MPLPVRRILAIGLAICAFAGGASAVRRQSVVDLLNQYESGKFAAVVSALHDRKLDFAELLDQLKEEGPKWIDAAGPNTRAKRRLVAATFAIEAARADAWHEWKWIVRQPLMKTIQIPGERATKAGGGYQPLNVLYWKPPPLLIEWACKLLREERTPSPVERWWHLAALAVAQRSEDPAFLVGDPAIGRGMLAGEIGNTQDEIKHLEHSRERFPAESRFLLGEAIARDRAWPMDAMKTYQTLEPDLGVGGEATTRLAMLQLRLNRPGDALQSVERASGLTREPFVVYLANYVRGRIHETQKRPELARPAYEKSVAAYPHGQAATLALAALLFQQGLRAEGQSLTGAMLAADPLPPDPWREWIHADDRFWPVLIGKLRAEIVK